MNINPHLLKINRNFLVCFVISASVSALVAQLLSDYDNYLNTTITIIAGYITFFGIFASMFYLDNKKRYLRMESGSVKKELVKLVSSLGLGEVVYLVVRWSLQFYFLEMELEPFAASLTSEIIATSLYMILVSVFLKATKTY
ncbi:MAG: hypothetical protein O6761_03780 [Thaumarchaeota archaeon]|nr:hypothetical protein [Nitrososphaerota archaeon]